MSNAISLRWAGSRICLVLLGMLLSLLLLEGGLRLSSSLLGVRVGNPRREPVPMYIHDVRLGHRPNPAYPGHDARGWRNAAMFSRADIVVFGDSQTFGLNVSMEDAWPQRLGELLHRSVYQMAFGGYGPAHYVPLLQEALPLHPKVIVAAYYFGNDLFDGYWFVYGVGEYPRGAADPVLDSLASADPRTRAVIARAEEVDPRLRRHGYLDCQSPRPVPDPGLQRVRNILAAPPVRLESPPSQTTALQGRTVSLLTRHSELFKMVHDRLPRLLGQDNPQQTLPDYGPPLCVHYQDRDLSTIFSPGYRLVVLDETDPRVVEGERIDLKVFKYLAESCHRAGIRFYVAMIPTKEFAFRARTAAALEREPVLAAQWMAEARARRRALGFFTREGIAYVDTLPALEKLIASGINPYKSNADGHPVRAGYEAIAHAVAASLEREGLSPRP